MMTFYAIRHKPTGFLMETYSRNRGYTHWEPDGQAIIPRLFDTHKGAKCALTWWLKGTTDRNLSTHWETGEHDEWISTTPVPSRKAEDMEIVTVELHVWGAH